MKLARLAAQLAAPLFALLLACLYAPLTALDAAAPDLSKVSSRADLEAVIAATEDAALKQALKDHTPAILIAAEQHPHVLAVIHTIESAPGTYTKANLTPATLKKAAGGELAIFDTLTLVSTSIANGKAHAYRDSKDDPYDAAFLEHLGHIPSLESVKIVATKIEDAWLPPLLKLKNLKSLSMEGTARGLKGNPALGDPSLARLRTLEQCPGLTSLELAYFGQATDAGLEQLSGLKNLESFTFRGTTIKGHGYAKLEGWTKLKRINYHSTGLDDEGLGHVCDRFPNLEFIKLWHSKLLTDASAEHLRKLKRLTGIEISCSKATAGLIRTLRELPMEYIALEYGVNSPAADAIETVKAIPTLRRLKLAANTLPDADLAAIAGAVQIQELSLSDLDLPEARAPLLQAFAHLKSLTLIRYGKGYPEETQAKIKTLLPTVAVTFVK